MAPDPKTVALVRHRDVVPWKRDVFERTLLRRGEVTAVFHGTRQVQVTFRCDRVRAVALLDDVASVTRFPVLEVSFEPAAGPGAPA